MAIRAEKNTYGYEAVGPGITVRRLIAEGDEIPEYLVDVEDEPKPEPAKSKRRTVASKE